MYSLRYSGNPFDCPGMLIGLGVVLGMLGLIAIAAICCFTCGKHWRQRIKSGRKRTNHNREDEPQTIDEHSRRYENFPPPVKSRYMRNPSPMQRRKHTRHKVYIIQIFSYNITTNINNTDSKTDAAHQENVCLH